MKRAHMRRTFCWWAVFGALVLPAASHMGYAPWHMGYGVLVSGALALAMIALVLSRWPIVCAALLTCVAALQVHLYFGAQFMQSPLGTILFLDGFLLLLWAALRTLDRALVLIGIMALAQIVSSALATSPYWVRDERYEARISDKPSIIHVVLDEHGSLSTIPRTAVSEARVDALRRLYVQAGFTVFDNAMAEEAHTHFSLARMFNPSTDQPRTFVHAIPANRFAITSAEYWQRIALTRALDITHGNFVDFSEALKSTGNVEHYQVYDENIVPDALIAYGMPRADRLRVLAAMLFTWFDKSAHAPLIAWYKAHAGSDVIEALELRARTHPLASRRMFESFIQRLRTEGQRGMYYFAHVLLPHYPYAFDSACALRPLSEWRSRVVPQTDDAQEMLRERDTRYALYFEQAQCTARIVRHMMDAVQANPALRDAVIILHGDHGARIGLPEGILSALAYTAADYRNDWLATFAAVRIPNETGGTDENPSTLRDIFQSLVDADFTSLPRSRSGEISGNASAR